MRRLPAGIRAVLFDMDGTLIDSEPLTDQVVGELLAEYNLGPPSFGPGDLHGRTWEHIEAGLVAEYPVLAGKSLVPRMQSAFDASMRAHMPHALPGAVEAFRSASRACITAIVSSSPRRTILYVIEQLGLSGECGFLVGAENVRHSKPHPECYLLAAANARVQPSECLVFEDSEAGIKAARDAGMRVVAVRGNRDASLMTNLAPLADFVVDDYAGLTGDFFAPPGPAS